MPWPGSSALRAVCVGGPKVGVNNKHTSLISQSPPSSALPSSFASSSLSPSSPSRRRGSRGVRGVTVAMVMVVIPTAAAPTAAVPTEEAFPNNGNQSRLLLGSGRACTLSTPWTSTLLVVTGVSVPFGTCSSTPGGYSSGSVASARCNRAAVAILWRDGADAQCVLTIPTDPCT